MSTASTVTTALVVENDPTDDVRRLGDWLTAAGLELSVVRPPAGDPLPEALDGYAALVVLGGAGHAYGEHPFAPVEGLLRRAVRHRVPTLGICLGAQLLATAHGGTVRPSQTGPEFGAALVARRDVAQADPLFARVPFAPDVIQWHHDEIAELPPGAVLLAASPRFPHQAFRLGDRAWGTQFHIETDPAMVAGWVSTSEGLLAELGLDPAAVVAGAEAVMADIAEVWQPFAARFAALARGELATPRARLPLLDRAADSARAAGRRTASDG